MYVFNILTKEDEKMVNHGNHVIEVRPVELLYIQMLLGGSGIDKLAYLKITADKLKNDPDEKIKLVTSFDDNGNKTDMYPKLNLYEMKIDLDILQVLGYVPGSIRTSRVMFELLNQRISELFSVLDVDTFTEKMGFIPDNTAYKSGKKYLVYMYDNSLVKKSSQSLIETADRLYIRMHHILCMTCFMDKGDESKSINEDNLYEFWMKIKDNPNIIITVTEGCEKCMICPPCSYFDASDKRCVSQGALRDRKKDLDIFNILGISPNESFRAKDLLIMIYNKIHTVQGICDYGFETLPEWKACQGTNKYGDYEKGMKYIKSKLGID